MTPHRPPRTEPATDSTVAAGSRRTIDQATGLLMGTFEVDAGTAAAVLSWLARHTDVAPAVVANRFLDAAHDVDPAAVTGPIRPRRRPAPPNG